MKSIAHDVIHVQMNGNFKRVNHDSDPIPIVPGRGMGYSHVAGEVHIEESDAWNSCSGDDSTASGCTIAEVPNIFMGNVLDHLGPYQGVYIGTTYCY